MLSDENYQTYYKTGLEVIQHIQSSVYLFVS